MSCFFVGYIITPHTLPSLYPLFFYIFTAQMCSGVSLLVTQAIVLTCTLHFFYHQQKKRSSSCGIRTRSRPPQSWRPLRNKPTRSALSDNGCARFWKPQKRTLLTSGRTLTKPAESWRSVTATWNGTPSVPKSQCVRR